LRTSRAAIAAWVTVVVVNGLCLTVQGWQTTISGELCSVDAAKAVALDGAGDVIAAGLTANGGFGGDFTVVKLSGANGAEQWRQVIDGSAHDWDEASAVTVDAAEDVVAVGEIRNASNDDDFAVVKLRGGDGSVLWSQMIDASSVPLPPSSTGGSEDYAFTVTTDTAGNVVAAGRLGAYLNGMFGTFFVVKLRGNDGAQLWHYTVGSAFFPAQANAVAVDGDGDVVAAGFTSFLEVKGDFTVVKLDGNSGREMWRQIVGGGVADALVILPNEDAVAVGFSAGSSHAIRFRGSDGSPMWSYPSEGYLVTVAADANGDVIAAGTAVVKLSGTGGAEIWRHGPWGLAEATRVDPDGNVVTAGSSAGGNISKWSGKTGAALWPPVSDPDVTALSVRDAGVDGSGNVVAVGVHYVPTNQDFVVVKLKGLDGSSFGRPTCPGDCNGDGVVTVDELIRGVDIALGMVPVCECVPIDSNHDRTVTVDEVLTAVGRALNGCSS
jgi:hypothetical protein